MIAAARVGPVRRDVTHPSTVDSQRSSFGSSTSLRVGSSGIESRTTTSGTVVDGSRMTSSRVREELALDRRLELSSPRPVSVPVLVPVPVPVPLAPLWLWSLLMAAAAALELPALVDVDMVRCSSDLPVMTEYSGYKTERKECDQ